VAKGSSYSSKSDDEILEEAKEAFTRCQDWHSENYKEAQDDIRFARLAEQWPEAIKKQREREARPCLTINKLPSFIRQVVNDARQNKPQIKVRPVDSGSDPETAEIFNGLIRNIEQSSNADVSYDTAADFAVSGGIGYIRVAIEYAHDDTFDRELRIERVANPFAVFGDPDSTAADSSDWNVAFCVDSMSKKEFEAQYKGAEKVDWDSEGYAGLGEPWLEGDNVLVAEYWTREEADRELVMLSDGRVMDRDTFAKGADLAEVEDVQIVDTRTTKTHKVKMCLLTGAEVLEEHEWGGKYIPIIPVYGDEINLEGKRYFRSLIHDAKDAQQMFNYWRTSATELVALAPKAPWVGKTGAFDTDLAKWDTANTQNHSFLQYDGEQSPQRQPFAGVPAGHLQEALNASDDMKAIMGVYDASLGARSNETSGRAIMARQREGDVSTFHFLDNLARGIRQVGRVLIDLIPKVYTGERIVRLLGNDGSVDRVPLGQPTPIKGPDGQPKMQPVPDPMTGQQQMQPIMKVFDLTAGKYDLTVETGPSYTTLRQEAAQSMVEMVQAFPPLAQVAGDLLFKNLDWPGADEIAERLKAMNPAAQGENPEIAKMKAELQKLTQENALLKQQAAGMKADKQVGMMGAETDQFAAQTDRLEVIADAMKPPPQPRPMPMAAGRR
jgi:hypothetical protein